VRQREKRSGGGACRQRLGNHLDAGGAGVGCPSVSSGRTASVESGIGGLLGGSTTVCRSSLRAVSFGCGRRLLGSFGVFSGGTVGAASGNSSAITPGPLESLSDSTRARSFFKLLNRSAPREAKARRQGHDNERSPSTGAHSGGLGGTSFDDGAYAVGVEG
jgi:hypothetical protein